MLAYSKQGIKATENWLAERWSQIQTRSLATRRPLGYGHLEEGCDIQLTRTWILRCPTQHKGALRSLMSGDTITDDIIIKQGDIAGDSEFVYFIIEGLAEVIQEKRDFYYYSLQSTDLFFAEQGAMMENSLRSQRTLTKQMKKESGNPMKLLQSLTKSFAQKVKETGKMGNERDGPQLNKDR